MSLTIELSVEAEAALKERAAGVGQDPSTYASRLVEQAVRKPTLEDILAPVRSEFVKSGMSDDDLSELLEDAKHEMRREARQ